MSYPVETDAAYLAGFFDGEGTMGIYYLGDNHRDSRNGNRYYSVRMSLCNSQREILGHLQSIWGGGLERYANHGWGKPLNRLSWTSQADALRILPRIIPYLHLKRGQAQLMIEYCQSRQSRASHKAGYSDREIEIAQEISELASAKGRRRHDRVPVAG